jgi:tripartite-type tricarboxylate transporter receptor subunit TctC
MDRREFVQAALALGAASSAPVFAQAYPAKTIKYIVPVVAGGGNDLVARTVAERWARVLGQSMVVENIGGGGGVIACQTTANAAPDGYTLMQGYVATHGTNPATRKVPYDPVKDFTPIGMIGATPNVLVVGAAVPAKDVKEFIEYAKKNANKISYGSAGPGSLTHLTMELFKQPIGVEIVHVPYKGIAPALTDLIGGSTQVMFPGLTAALAHIKSGRIRPLAVTGTMRHPLLPDVPTLAELGFVGFEAAQWYGVVGPAGIPAPIVTKLNETLNAVIATPELKEKLAVEAIQPMPMTPAQFGQYITAEIAKWGKVARERNIQLDS